jgi:hypothetical protein
MTEPERTPHTSERAEGDPPGNDATGGRTPHPEEPAEGAEELPEGYNIPGP